jgi:hypothetical protein
MLIQCILENVDVKQQVLGESKRFRENPCVKQQDEDGSEDFFSNDFFVSKII